MPKTPTSTLRAMLAAQYADALAATSASKLSNARADAMSYYNGDMSKDMPTAPGRSTAVSMDVLDTVEGIMPQLMEVFCGTDEVVKFEPVGPEDVQAAEQETDYINHVFMNQNPGFLVLYSFIKDALLSKVGIVKAWWEEEEREERETYYDQTEDAYALIVANPDVEVVEHSEHPAEESDMVLGQHPGALPAAVGNGLPSLPNQPSQTLHDVTVVTKKKYARARVMGVPPEEFGIERGARSIRDCNYCFHKIVDRTETDLIEQGYDEKQVKALPSYRAWTNTEEIDRDTVDESSGAGSQELNTAARPVEITEHYVRMDYERDGKSCLYKVTTGGHQGEILKLDGKDDIVRFDAIPFAAMTPVIVTHRFHGKSLADLVMDIQRVKTALLRTMLDAAYLALNRQKEVAESHASENTLDDLLVSRPGGIVRVKQPGGIREIEQGDIGPQVYSLLEYQDQRLETRTGFTKRGQGIEPDALSNQSATAAKIVENASQARVRLIARIFAETGIRDLFWLLHSVIKKHGQEAAVVRLRNQWASVDPRNWKTRDDLTIHVGLGQGSKMEQLAETNMVIAAQEKGVAAGIVSKKNLYNTAKRLTKIIGERDPEAFFVDPAKPPDPQQPAAAPIPPPTDPAMIKSQADMQVQGQKAQLEQQKSQADTQHQIAKTQAEMALAEKKFELERQLKLIDAELKLKQHQMDMEKHHADLQMQAAAHQQTSELEQSKFQMDTHHKTLDANARLAEKGLAQDGNGSVATHPAIADALNSVVETNKQLIKTMAAPRKTRATKDKKTGEWQSVSEVTA